jgi:CBS domain-containing protein
MKSISSRPVIRHLREQRISLSTASSPFGERERLAEKYLAQKEWTVERLLQSRRVLKEKTRFAPQLGVNWIEKNALVIKAVEEMVEKDVGSLLVCDSITAERKTFLGILTERDFLRKVLVKGLSSKSTACEVIMTPRQNLSVVTLDHSLYECLNVFENSNFRHLPVVAHRGDLGPGEEDVLAVLSQRDLVQEFRKFHEANVQYIESFVDFPIW